MAFDLLYAGDPDIAAVHIGDQSFSRGGLRLASQRAATLGMNAVLELSDRTQLALGVDQRFASRDRSRSATGSFRLAW